MKKPEEIKLEFTREWVRRAENDYRITEHLFESGEAFAYGVTFHACSANGGKVYEGFSGLASD